MSEPTWDDLRTGRYQVPDRPVRQYSQKEIAKMPRSSSKEWVRFDDVGDWLMAQETRQMQECLAHMMEVNAEEAPAT